MNEKKILRMMLDLGIGPDLKGYDYLTYALSSVKGTRRKPTMGLYQEIAQKFDTTPSRVERCIRHAITTCFDKMHPLTEEIFGEFISPDSGKIANRRFICILAEWLYFEGGDQVG